MQFNGVTCDFHHMGIPTVDKRPNERFSERFRMYTSDSDCRGMRVQWHRFEPDSQIHPLIQSAPHAAFKVDDLERAIAGYPVLLGPFEPIAQYRVAIIEDGGHPIEFVETSLTDEQLWARTGPESMLYSSVPENAQELNVARNASAGDGSLARWKALRSKRRHGDVCSSGRNEVR